VDDSIIFFVTIKMVNMISETKPPQCLSQSLRWLHDNADTTKSDVHFRFPGSSATVKAHQNILMARSPYFKAMFESEMSEAQSGSILIEDVSDDIMKELIAFIYTNEFSSDRVVSSHAQELLLASMRFELGDAAAICVEYLAKTLSTKNVSSLLVLADANNVVDLKKRCIDFAVSECPDIFYELAFSANDGSTVPSSSVKSSGKRTSQQESTSATPKKAGKKAKK
jgi:hypothetical protein